MRIVIAGPPKTGNVWLKCLLASIYGLKVIKTRDLPARPDLTAFKEWRAQGGFPDGSIYHQHYVFSNELCDLIDAVPAHAVTIVRDPYDAFVSRYFTLQKHTDDERRRERGRDLLMGRPLDHPDVLTYLRNDGYRSHLERANAWLHSGRSAAIRYEDLHRDPISALAELTDQIESVAAERITPAIAACSAESMRQSDRTARHIRTATVGDSRNHLTEAHLAIFRERYGDLIRSLRYAVR